MITLKAMMTLTQPFISAASGLVELDGKFYVMADDENFLGVFNPQTHSGQEFQIFEAPLPDEFKARKKVKPDIESLVYLPAQNHLLAIPSGSTPNRQKGALIITDGTKFRDLSFQELYAKLAEHFQELNIEGGAVRENELWLWQRGNGKSGQNGIIRLNLDSFLSGKIEQLSIKNVDLGLHSNVNVSFTDGCITDKGIFFLAAAEDSSSTYLDGEVLASFLGMQDANGNVLYMEQLELKSKPEGLCMNHESSCFYIVTDDDDRSRPATLLAGMVPSEWKSFLVL